MRRTSIILLLLALVLLVLFLLMDPSRKHQSQSVSVLVDPPEIPLKIVNVPDAKEASMDASSAYGRWLDASAIQKDNIKRYHKISIDGELINDNGIIWACVYDSLAGLLWEVKENNGSWQDRDQTYSWYQNEQNNQEGLLSGELEPLVGTELKPIELSHVGVANKGQCLDIRCDTQAYVNKANQQWLCSASQWRLPEAFELAMLDHVSNYQPDIDRLYFPNTVSAYYWLRTQAPNSQTLAWAVDFNNGFPYITEKRIAHHIRLVTDAPWLDFLKSK